MTRLRGHRGSLGNGRWADTGALAGWLLEEAHVAVVPGSVFGAEDCLRISFAVSHEHLVEAADRIVAALTARRRVPSSDNEEKTCR